MTEKLLFSLAALISAIDNPDNWDDDGLVIRRYYDGEEYNERIPSDGSASSRFLDSVEIFDGLVDESKIVIKQQSPDELYDELFSENKVLS